MNDKLDVICIEAKQSRHDYYNGYSTGGDFNYVIAPKGMLHKDELLPGVGLIEVDLAELEIGKNMGILKGLKIMKKATRNQEILISREQILMNIAYKNTFECVFNRNGLYQENTYFDYSAFG